MTRYDGSMEDEWVDETPAEEYPLDMTTHDDWIEL